MRNRGGVCAAAGVVLILAGVAGCSGPTPAPSPSEPVAKTMRASRYGSAEEALKAATAAFQRYLDLANLIGSEGGAAPERISDFLSADLAAEAIANYRRMQADGVRLEGATTVRDMRLVQENADLVQMYACMEGGATRLIDRNGVDVTPHDRQLSTPLVVDFEPAPSGDLQISKSEQWPWPDNDIC